MASTMRRASSPTAVLIEEGARLLLARHGIRGALQRARKLAQELAASGDPKGASIWWSIVAELENLGRV